jgi:hypothetical protein
VRSAIAILFRILALNCAVFVIREVKNFDPLLLLLSTFIAALHQPLAEWFLLPFFDTLCESSTMA